MITFFLYLEGIVLGAVFGSTFTAWIPRSENPLLHTTLRSACPACKRTLAWYELLPILSFVGLGGVCRTCKHSIPRWYLAAELGGAVIGLLFVQTARQYHFTIPEFILVASILYLLYLSAVYDAAYRLIPLLPSIIGCILSFLLHAIFYHTSLYSLLGIAISGGFFLAQFVISRGRWIGSGDIWLGLFAGAFVGYPYNILALWITYVGGSLISLFLLLTGHTTRSTKLPLGTYLVFGTLIAKFFGHSLVQWFYRFI